jgi:hypothetical protein
MILVTRSEVRKATGKQADFVTYRDLEDARDLRAENRLALTVRPAELRVVSIEAKVADPADGPRVGLFGMSARGEKQDELEQDGGSH